MPHKCVIARKQYLISWRKKNYTRIKAQQDEWRKTHQESHRARRRAYEKMEKRKEHARRYHQKRRRADLNFRVRCALRARINSAIKRGTKSASTLKLLGCSMEEFRAWLSGWFEHWMNWNNYGEWEIDHFKPCACFDLSDPAQQQICFHYLNLRPLSKADNKSKSDKIMLAA